MLTCLDYRSSWGGQIAPIASRTVQFTKEQLGQAEDKVSSNCESLLTLASEG